jgi:hypothetical protein
MERMQSKRQAYLFLSRFFLTASLFSGLVWLLGVNFTHPEWLTLPLTHLNRFPLNIRTDNAGVLTFALSCVSFLLMSICSVESLVRRRAAPAKT